MPSENRHINFALMRDRVLAQKSGKQFWRSLEELSDSPEFHEFVAREYPQHAEEWNSPVERRTFLKIMGASLALAGLSGCVYQPPEKIVPYVNTPEGEIPGKPLFYASAMTLGGYASGILARSSDGRPTKIEGNPDHPDSLGATDLFAQGSLLCLYDPDRATTVTLNEQISPWTKFLGDILGLLNTERPRGGSGLRFLTETVTSPTLAAQIKSILTEFPKAKWHQYEPASRSNAHLGAKMAFGQTVNTTYDFEKADRIFSIRNGRFVEFEYIPYLHIGHHFFLDLGLQHPFHRTLNFFDGIIDNRIGLDLYAFIFCESSRLNGSPHIEAHDHRIGGGCEQYITFSNRAHGFVYYPNGDFFR